MTLSTALLEGLDDLKSLHVVENRDVLNDRGPLKPETGTFLPFFNFQLMGPTKWKKEILEPGERTTNFAGRKIRRTFYHPCGGTAEYLVTVLDSKFTMKVESLNDDDSDSHVSFVTSKPSQAPSRLMPPETSRRYNPWQFLHLPMADRYYCRDENIRIRSSASTSRQRIRSSASTEGEEQQSSAQQNDDNDDEPPPPQQNDDNDDEPPPPQQNDDNEISSVNTIPQDVLDVLASIDRAEWSDLNQMLGNILEGLL